VVVDDRRYLVDSALRGRRVFVLFDPFDTEYVLIEYDGRVVQRAFPQKPGPCPQGTTMSSQQTHAEKTDYLALLRSDYENRVRSELKALDIRQQPQKTELSLLQLVALFETCRGFSLSDSEHNEVSAFFRKMRPIDPPVADAAFVAIRRKFGTALHLSVYLDAFQSALVRHRTKGGMS
jgi:hypothetical protein